MRFVCAHTFCCKSSSINRVAVWILYTFIYIERPSVGYCSNFITDHYYHCHRFSLSFPPFRLPPLLLVFSLVRFFFSYLNEHFYNCSHLFESYFPFLRMNTIPVCVCASACVVHLTIHPFGCLFYAVSQIGKQTKKMNFHIYLFLCFAFFPFFFHNNRKENSIFFMYVSSVICAESKCINFLQLTATTANICRFFGFEHFFLS